ncbi:hypothetical protein CKO51_29900 [Rhodopirellula sp. SM50]|nr:hypothetical protein CKO51_29900 [Rhodopirellula sp. SM50]
MASQSDATAAGPGLFHKSPPVSHPWHGGYYHQSWGQPLAVVVPPTANMRQTYSWGVGQNLMYPINSQYGRNAPGIGAGPRGAFRPTPPWPSHTDQFGYYYIRAPW